MPQLRFSTKQVLPRDKNVINKSEIGKSSAWRAREVPKVATIASRYMILKQVSTDGYSSESMIVLIAMLM
jgi:hypothetical protein